MLLRRRVPERSMLSLSCSAEEMEGMRVPEKAALRFEPVSVEPDAKRDRVSGDRRGAAPPCASQKKKRKKLTFVDQTSDQKQSIQRRCRERVLLCPFEHGRAASGEIGWESGEMYSPSIGGYERDLPRLFFFFFFFLPSSAREKREPVSEPRSTSPFGRFSCPDYRRSEQASIATGGWRHPRRERRRRKVLNDGSLATNDKDVGGKKLTSFSTPSLPPSCPPPPSLLPPSLPLRLKTLPPSPSNSTRLDDLPLPPSPLAPPPPRPRARLLRHRRRLRRHHGRQVRRRVPVAGLLHLVVLRRLRRVGPGRGGADGERHLEGLLASF